MKESWNEELLYCVKCGTLNKGYRRHDGKLKFECSNKACRLVLVRTQKSRRHEIVDIYEKAAILKNDSKNV